MQDNDMTHTTNKFMRALAEVFSEQMWSRGLWSARSPDLNPCDFNLWGTVWDKEHVKNPHSLRELNENIRQ